MSVSGEHWLQQALSEGLSFCDRGGGGGENI